MKIIVTLLMLLALFLPNAYPEDYTQLALPKGAIARLGRGAVETVQYSPDGALLAVVSSMGIWLYNGTTHEETGLLMGDLGSFSTVVFSPDGKLLASGGEDAKVVLWDPVTGEQRRELTWNKKFLNFVWDKGKLLDLAFSPDGSMLATTSGEGKVRLWDVETGAVTHTMRLAKYGRFASNIESISFSADGRMLAGGRGTFGDPARVWDTSTGELKGVLPPAAGRVESVAFSPADGKLLATGNRGGTVFLWKVPD